MDTDELKRTLQEHFTDGLVTIIGSGLSAASGLPMMDELADYLLEEMPKRLTGKLKSQWQPIAQRLAGGIGLEPALNNVDADNQLVPDIVELTATLIASREADVICGVCSGNCLLPFSNLLKYLTFHTSRVSVITSNYDRLIEHSAEMAGFGIDTAFVGQYYGRFDPKLSKKSLGRTTQTHTRKALKIVYQEHVAIFKPHGSLDWFDYNGEPVRSTIPINAPRLMITPGQSKYRMGYDSPFDFHRNAANEAIDRAARYLIIGYGFNDDQLETHLRRELGKGKPCLILTRSLTSNAAKLVSNYESVMAVSRGEENGEMGTKVTYSGVENFYPKTEIWNLEDFIREVLQ